MRINSYDFRCGYVVPAFLDLFNTSYVIPSMTTSTIVLYLIVGIINTAKLASRYTPRIDTLLVG